MFGVGGLKSFALRGSFMNKSPLGKLLFSQTWNRMTVSHRKTLLKEAGYTPNIYAYRAWDAVPFNVRLDLEYTHKRTVH